MRISKGQPCLSARSAKPRAQNQIVALVETQLVMIAGLPKDGWPARFLFGGHIVAHRSRGDTNQIPTFPTKLNPIIHQIRRLRTSFLCYDGIVRKTTL